MILRTLLLLALLLLVVARLRRWFGQHLPPKPAGPAVEAAQKCPDCGAYVVGSRPDPCARADCRFR